jgi:hypothetical protein
MQFSYLSLFSQNDYVLFSFACTTTLSLSDLIQVSTVEGIQALILDAVPAIFLEV